MAPPNDEEIEYVQVIDNIPYAFFTAEDTLFDCANPRTDIEKMGYGYSLVEQAIDLVTSAINTFMYNAGFFQENKLPRGILLLQGDAGPNEIEQIEELYRESHVRPPYLAMAGSRHTFRQIRRRRRWRKGSRRLEWVNLQGTDTDMGFQSWFDLRLSGVAALFGSSMEDYSLPEKPAPPWA